MPNDIIEEKVSKAFEERAITNEELDELFDKVMNEDATPSLKFVANEDID